MLDDDDELFDETSRFGVLSLDDTDEDLQRGAHGGR